MVELQRGGEVESCSLSYYKLAVDMRPGEGRRKVNGEASLIGFEDGRDGNRLLVRRRPHGQPVAHCETVRTANLDFQKQRQSVAPRVVAVRKTPRVRRAGALNSRSGRDRRGAVAGRKTFPNLPRRSPRLICRRL